MIADPQLHGGVQDRQQLQTDRLMPWLRGVLPSSFDGALLVRKFAGGQSNPTYCLETNVGAFVLRKKPQGALLASAHAIDREYRVMHALAGTAVPVPSLLGYCEDEAVLGTAFYLMRYVPGRMLGERTIAQGSVKARQATYLDMVQVLGVIHALDWQALGLADFGRPDRYMQRQVERWTRQLELSLTADWPAMRSLSEWLSGRLPVEARTSLVHGDYRLGNVLIDPELPRVRAVLDWELSTIGHPFADLGYYCISYELPSEFGGCQDLDLEVHGIPSRAQVLAHYAAHCGAGFSDANAACDLDMFVVFSMFRLAAIGAGVYRRAMDGNAADDRAMSHWRRYQYIGEAAWRLAQAIEWGDTPRARSPASLDPIHINTKTSA